MPSRSALATFAAPLHDPRWRPHWRWLLALLVVVAAWFAFTPRPPEPFGSHDKIQHMAAFATLAVVAALCGAAGWRQTAAAAAGLLFYGGFIEVVQTFLPDRQGEWADLGADAVGIAFGLALTAALRHACRPPRLGRS